MNYDYEPDAYHPRYIRSEYLTYEEQDRRQRRVALVGACISIAAVIAAIAYFATA